ncbi:unnamed protein product [Pocillopora meandrina]|uniref:PH domain-containing protein n=1 Tax=Pocillopora meandrina TaxID=46732 RepID=A0AAU9X4B7_9CNID|nr:unnamed protein product [Pocillopora meandrina]
MHAQSTYFHQGYDLMNDLDAYMKRVSNQVEEVSVQFTMDKKEMEERHTLVQKMEESGCIGRRNLNDASGLVMEGYLFKKSSNAFRSWHRRYFTVQNNQLMYQKRLKDDQTVLVEDLRLCKVRLAEETVERRFMFEVVSPTKSWYLQADSEALQVEWMEAMQLMTELGNELVNGILEAKVNSHTKKPTPQSSRGERETWMMLKYVQQKFVSLETFLKNCQTLDKGIIRDLARMKVHHEERHTPLAFVRTDSKKKKLAMKLKSKMDN